MRIRIGMRPSGVLLAVALVLGAEFLQVPNARSDADAVRTYIVLLEGTASDQGFVIGPIALQAVRSALESAGGVITADLTRQIGVVIANSANPMFAAALRANPLIAEVGEDFSWKALEPSASSSSTPISAPSPGEDPLEFQQWGMRQSRAVEARAIQMGSPAVDVAVLDTGIDPTHQDFFVGTQSNIDMQRARSFVPLEPDPFVDVGRHGTFVSGVIAARKNDLGIVGVAPNITLIPVKLIDVNDNLFASWAVQGITYAGDIQADVINMSWFMDDGDTVFYCKDDPAPRAARQAVERAIHYARTRGALPVAAIGNFTDELDPNDECAMVPQETPGVVTVGGIDKYRDLASYSNYGLGVVDIVAPAGDNDRGELPPNECPLQFSTRPGNAYDCAAGTSFAAPYVSGAAALVISQYGTVGEDGDVKMSPSDVEEILLGSSIDIGIQGQDKCYGVGSLDVLRAVLRDRTPVRDEWDCLHYDSDSSVPAASSCPGPQITDKLNDAPTDLVSTADNLDIVSAAFTAQGQDTLQITLTIKNLSLPPPPEDAPFAVWAVYFEHGNTFYTVQANGGAGNPATLRYTAGPSNGDEQGNEPTPNNPEIPGSFQPGPNGTIVFRVPLSFVGSPPAGVELTKLVAGTYRASPVSVSPIVDRAPNGGFGENYTVGRVCIPTAEAGTPARLSPSTVRSAPLQTLRSLPTISGGSTFLALGRALNEPGSIGIHDVSGRLVRSIPVGAGMNGVTWDGRATDGRPVARGLYFARLSGPAAIAIARIIVIR